jgi:hypothetical protein
MCIFLYILINSMGYKFNYMMIDLFTISKIARSGNVAVECKKLSVSRSSYYRRKKILLTEGASALDKAKSKRPKTSPNKTPRNIEQKIIRMANSLKFRYYSEIASKVKEQGYKITYKTVQKICNKNDILLVSKREGLNISNKSLVKLGPKAIIDHIRIQRPSN